MNCNCLCVFRLKLSPLLPAAIDILKYKEYVKTDAAKNYLQRVVLSILRTQPDGLPISLLVHNNPKLLSRNDLHRIAKQWLPESMHQVRSLCICRNSEKVDNTTQYLRIYILLLLYLSSAVDIIWDNEYYFQADY